MELLKNDLLILTADESGTKISLAEDFFANQVITVHGPVLGFLQYTAFSDLRGTPMVLTCNDNVVANLFFNDERGTKFKHVDLTPSLKREGINIVRLKVILFGVVVNTNAQFTLFDQGKIIVDRYYQRPNQMTQVIDESWSLQFGV